MPLQPTDVATASSLPARPVPELPPSATPTSIAGEIKLVELQRDKLALELEVLKPRKASTADTTLSKDANNGVDLTKSGSTRKKRTIDWPHEFCPGAPINEFEKLELTDFVAGFLSMIKTYDAPCKEVMLQHLQLLMIKALSYTWKSICSFHAHIAKQVELFRLEFSDLAMICDNFLQASGSQNLGSSTTLKFICWGPILPRLQQAKQSLHEV